MFHFAQVASGVAIGCTVSPASLAGMPDPFHNRPPGVVVAVAGTAAVAVALIGLAVASLVAGHGGFSNGVAIFLLGYGAIMLAAATALWRLSVFGRGPVVALALLNLISAVSFTGDAPWVWLVVLVSAVTLVAGALPSTSRALHLRRAQVRPAGGLPQTDDRGK